MQKAVYSIAEFKALLPTTGRLVGLDVGTETIGVAVSDARRIIASPDLTLYRRKWSEDAAALSAMLEKQEIAGFVVGYPLNMDGTAGPRAQATRAFARNLQSEFPMPLLLWDERLSTAAVNRMMIDEMDINRKRRAELVDKLAASYILQGVLDGLGHGESLH
ncbi:MAG: Holliday junction resolvase RuvX [Rickettsiales bacterium]|nr:Holliday junction resolvase RuvX [Rickettsiales bacterium]